MAAHSAEAAALGASTARGRDGGPPIRQGFAAAAAFFAAGAAVNSGWNVLAFANGRFGGLWPLLLAAYNAPALPAIAAAGAWERRVFPRRPVAGVAAPLAAAVAVLAAVSGGLLPLAVAWLPPDGPAAAAALLAAAASIGAASAVAFSRATRLSAELWPADVRGAARFLAGGGAGTLALLALTLALRLDAAAASPAAMALYFLAALPLVLLGLPAVAVLAVLLREKEAAEPDRLCACPPKDMVAPPPDEERKEVEEVMREEEEEEEAEEEEEESPWWWMVVSFSVALTLSSMSAMVPMLVARADLRVFAAAVTYTQALSLFAGNQAAGVWQALRHARALAASGGARLVVFVAMCAYALGALGAHWPDVAVLALVAANAAFGAYVNSCAFTRSQTVGGRRGAAASAVAQRMTTALYVGFYAGIGLGLAMMMAAV